MLVRIIPFEGTNLTYVGLDRMEGKPAELRRQAEYCRQLALGIYDQRTKCTLVQMADDYDAKANRAERERQHPTEG
jgi:hypothetical protein